MTICPVEKLADNPYFQYAAIKVAHELGSGALVRDVMPAFDSDKPTTVKDALHKIEDVRAGARRIVMVNAVFLQQQVMQGIAVRPLDVEKLSQDPVYS